MVQNRDLKIHLLSPAFGNEHKTNKNIFICSYTKQNIFLCGTEERQGEREGEDILVEVVSYDGILLHALDSLLHIRAGVNTLHLFFKVAHLKNLKQNKIRMKN